MPSIYEGMFLIDNDSVRADWRKAKAVVGDLLAKHGGKVHTARRWDERKLCYRIRRKNRATFLLVHYEIGVDAIKGFVRDLEINETILRYMLLAVDAIPPAEFELSKAEESKDFVVPAPPPDDAVVAGEEEQPEADYEANPTGPARKVGRRDEPKEDEPKEDEDKARAETESVEPEPALAATDADDSKEG